MTKPVGYYISYSLGDGSLLEQLEEEYGSTFQKISKREKLLLIQSLATELGDSLHELPRDEIYQLQEKLNTQLSQSDRAALIQALISQIRCGENLVVSEGEVSMHQ